jgi:hypothetical protein
VRYHQWDGGSSRSFRPGSASDRSYSPGWAAVSLAFQFRTHAPYNQTVEVCFSILPDRHFDRAVADALPQRIPSALDCESAMTDLHFLFTTIGRSTTPIIVVQEASSLSCVGPRLRLRILLACLLCNPPLSRVLSPYCSKHLRHHPGMGWGSFLLFEVRPSFSGRSSPGVGEAQHSLL